MIEILINKKNEKFFPLTLKKLRLCLPAFNRILDAMGTGGILSLFNEDSLYYDMVNIIVASSELSKESIENMTTPEFSVVINEIISLNKDFFTLPGTINETILTMSKNKSIA